MYHTIGRSIFQFLEAVLTFEQVIVILNFIHIQHRPYAHNLQYGCTDVEIKFFFFLSRINCIKRGAYIYISPKGMYAKTIENFSNFGCV